MEKFRSEKIKTAAMLAAIFLLGFSVVYLSHGPRLSDPDAYFQYRMAQYVLEEGRVPELYTLAYYPEGRRPWIQDTLVVPYFFAYTYKLLGAPFGLSLMEYAMVFPAIFGGGLASVFLCLAASELFGRRVGLLSALIYSFIPLSLSRVYSGTIDKEVLYGFFVYLSLYFFVKSYKNGFSIKNLKTLLAPVLSGIFFGFAYANWSGGAYIVLVISVAAAIYYVFERNVNIMRSIIVMVAAGGVVMKLVQPAKYGLKLFISDTEFVVAVAVSAIPLMSVMLSDFLKSKYKRDLHWLKICAAIFIFLTIIAFPLGKGEAVTWIFNQLAGYAQLGKGAQADIYMATVAESQPTHFLGGGDTLLQKIASGDLFIHLNLILFVIPLGVFLLLKREKNFPVVFALVWIISGFLAAHQGKRLLFFLAPSAAVVAGFAFISTFDWLKREERKIQQMLKSKKQKYAAERRAGNIKAAHLIVLFIAFAVIFSTLDATVASVGFRKSDLPTPWYDALMWTRQNTPEDSVILFWWDYGYWFQAVANRYTVADGGGNVERNTILAKMFTSPEEDAMEYIKKFVDYEKVPTYMVVSYEEFGKSGAINRIAQDELYIVTFSVRRSGDVNQDNKNIADIFARNKITTYYIVGMRDFYQIWALLQVDENKNYRPEWSEKLLVKLLSFSVIKNGEIKLAREDLKHFELVYTDQYGYIYIYKVK
ncbi:MAG: STT3 domain-containing protein [Methanobacteriota archaeon]